MAYEGWQDTATARVPLVLPAAYGYVLLSAFISACAISFLSESVAKARKKYKVDYPEFYASHYVTEGRFLKEDEVAANKRFNCYQRAHQNALETYPQFLLFLLIGGLADPIISACGGIVYSAGKVAYGLGYHTGDPRKRMWGAPAYIGLLMCVCTFLRFAIQLCRGKQANGV